MTDRPAEHFERMYQSDADPWGFRTAWYERRKYAITIASLPKEHYAKVWEPGCSIGELTLLLAGRADVIDASDISETAVSAAAAATAHLPGVQVCVAGLPDPPPSSGYDLVMLSEILYYMPPQRREQTLRCVEAVTAAGADLVIVHWRGSAPDTWGSGAEVNDEIRNRPGWRSVARHDEPNFVLDVLTRTGPGE